MDNRWTGAGAAVTASPPPRRRNPDHPPYAEMVRAALLAQAENGGSTEAVISRYIISAYPGIPPGHPRLLPYYLRKLVTARELSVSPSGRYLLPDSCPCESSAPPPSPKLNALPSPNPSFVLRLRKSISDEDGSGLKVGWCYVGDGSTSSPSVTDQQSGTVTKKPGGESYSPILASMQAEPEKAPLPPSPSPVWDPKMEDISLTLRLDEHKETGDPNMEGMSQILGLDEHKESPTGSSPINEQQLGSESRKQDGVSGGGAKKPGGESHLPVQASMLTEPEKALLSPPLISNPNLESIFLVLGLDEPKESLAILSPTNKQLSKSESRKPDGESESEAKKPGVESYLLVPASIQAELEEALVPSSPVSVPNIEGISPTLGPDDPKKSLSPSPVLVSNMEVISPTLALNDPKELLVVPSPVDEQQLGSEDRDSYPPIPILMQIMPEEALLPPSPSPRDSFMKCSSLDNPKESLLVPIPNQQSGSKSEKQHDDSNLLTSVTMQVEPEREPLLPTQPMADPNIERISLALGFDELKESWPVAPCITNQQPGSEPAKHNRESLLMTPVSMQTQLEKEHLSPPLPSLVLESNMERISSTLGLDEPKELLVVPSPITEQQLEKEHLSLPLPSLVLESNMERISSRLGLDEPKELLVVPSPVTEQQLGSENGESHPSVLVSMQIESEEALLPPPPLSDPNLKFTSPILGLDKFNESSPILASIAEQQSENESTKQDEESHPLTTVSIHADVEIASLLPPQPVLGPNPNMEWASQVLGLDELKESSSVSHTITEQQSGSDHRKQDGEPHSLAPDSMQVDSEEVLPLPPSPPESGRLQTKPDAHMPEMMPSPAPLNPETNGERSSSALTLDEVKESLPVPTPIANQQSGTRSNKQDMDAHPPNLSLMQIEPGKEPSPPPISMQLQAEPEPKLSSPDYVPEKPLLTLGEKKSLSGKPRPKRRKLWYE